MKALEEYTDEQIVSAILKGDASITKEFLYKKCSPLFRSIFHKYYTDCENSYELANEIYVYIMTPKKNNGKCKLEDFGFRCSLMIWLKFVTEHYCNWLFKKRIVAQSLEDDDRNIVVGESIDIDLKRINMKDLQVILQMMRNERYRNIIQYRYLEEKSNEETAALLNMTMDNYYNKHRLAKAQFCQMLKKEGLI
jgi:hypothetical protein